MADISKITLPSGTSYDFKDAKARAQIEALRGQVTGQVHYVGVTTTALTNLSTTKPIQIGGPITRRLTAILLFMVKRNSSGQTVIASGTNSDRQAPLRHWPLRIRQAGP